MSHSLSGAGRTLATWLDMLRTSLPPTAAGYWDLRGGEDLPGLPWNFEQVAWRLLIATPLLGLLLAPTLTGRRRQIVLLTALGPAVTFAGLCWASPSSPLPGRYLMPVSFLALAAPAVLLDAGWQSRRRLQVLALPVPLLVLAAGGLVLPRRAVEAAHAVRIERIPLLHGHRAVTYYNLGLGSIPAEQVAAVNDGLDRRAASGDPTAWDGLSVGLAGIKVPGLAADETVLPLQWHAVRSAWQHKAETDGSLSPRERAAPEAVAFNVGWGLGIRTAWSPQALQALIAEADTAGEWPVELDQSSVWRGFGFGLGAAQRANRAARGRPAGAAVPPLEELLADIPSEHRRAVQAGIEVGATPPPAKAPAPRFTSRRPVGA